MQHRVEATVRTVLLSMGFDLTGDARPLTPEEIKLHEAVVAEFVQTVGGALDFLLTHANRAHEECEIWTIEDEMALKYAHFILKRASAVGWLGTAVRQIERAADLGNDKDVAWDFTKRLINTPMFIANNGGLAPWINS